MLSNLLAEMKRSNIKNVDLGKLLNCSTKTIHNKISGRSDLYFPEAELIRNTYFPEMQMEYLFASKINQK